MLLLDARSVEGACSADGPHPHQGKLKPFKRGRPESIRLGSSEEKVLAAGQPWFHVQRNGNVGIGKAVVDVAAPTELVWGQILDFGKYPGKVPRVSVCEVYNKQKKGRAEQIFVRFVSPVLPGYKFEYFVHHIYEKGKNSLTWCLDYDKYSDFDDVQGHWHVEPHPTNPGISRVFYEVQLMAPPYLPRMIVNVLTSKAIKDATTWVRTFSEKEAKRLGVAPKKEEAVAA